MKILIKILDLYIIMVIILIQITDPRHQKCLIFPKKEKKTMYFGGETWQPGFNTTLNQTNLQSGIAEGNCNVFDSII